MVALISLYCLVLLITSYLFSELCCLWWLILLAKPEYDFIVGLPLLPYIWIVPAEDVLGLATSFGFLKSIDPGLVVWVTLAIASTAYSSAFYRIVGFEYILVELIVFYKDYPALSALKKLLLVDLLNFLV